MKKFILFIIILLLVVFFLIANVIYFKAFFEAKTGIPVSLKQYDDCRIDNLNALIFESNATGKAILLKFDDEYYHLIAVNEKNLIIDKNEIIKNNVPFKENQTLLIDNKYYNNPLILAIVDIKDYQIISKIIVNKNNLNQDGIEYIEYFLKFKK